MIKFKFQNLEVYQLSRNIVKETYVTTNNFPEKEKFSLSSQMNRAAVSIPSNIAEGYSRYNTTEKIRFLNISYSSLMELVCQYQLAMDLGFITKDNYESFADSAHELSVKITNFIRTLKRKAD